MHYLTILSLTHTCTLLSTIYAQVSKYQPCPLLGACLPPPQIDPSSPALQSAFADFTSYIDEYVEKGTGEFGPITPITTTFSIALFASFTFVENSNITFPFFYEYHHTASGASGSLASGPHKVNANSVYAIGDLTQLFAVLMLLAEDGGEVWSHSIVE